MSDHSDLNEVPMEDKSETEPVNEREKAVQTRREDLNPADELKDVEPEHTPEDDDV